MNTIEPFELLKKIFCLENRVRFLCRQYKKYVCIQSRTYSKLCYHVFVCHKRIIHKIVRRYTINCRKNLKIKIKKNIVIKL